mmetsp:Transcript_5542/g.7090  ORF Transcript_5542/g.7090 Transcript_5542/m.7090 type:complete len:310 (+) Transcript_5542:275-1204(+)
MKTSTTSEQCLECSPQIEIFSKSNQNLDNNMNYTIYFRPLQESDRAQIKSLHEELFPVEYTEHFYDTVVQNVSMDEGKSPLFSCVAVVETQDEEDIQTSTISSSLNGIGVMHDQYDAWGTLANYVGIQHLREDRLYDTIKGAMSETQLYSSPPSFRQIIQQGDAIVGCVVGIFLDISNMTPNNELIDRLIIDPYVYTKVFYIMTLGCNDQFRNRGLGSKLIEDCINLVEQVGECGVMYLHVITYNKAAIRFYERLGFHRIQEIEDYYTIDEEKYNCYLYAKFFHGNRRSLKTIISSAYERLRSYVTVFF